MSERRLFEILMVAAGAGVGMLIAIGMDIRSWPDAKLFVVGGVVAGFAMAKLVETVFRRSE